LSGRGLCDELITRPEEFYRLCCVVVCDLETSRIGAPYIYDISNLRVNISLDELLGLKSHKFPCPYIWKKCDEVNLNFVTGILILWGLNWM